MPESFTHTFLGDVLLRAGLGLFAMLCSFGGGALGGATGSEWGPFLGAVAGLVVGLVLAFLLYRRLPRRARWLVSTGRLGSATHSLHEPG